MMQIEEISKTFDQKVRAGMFDPVALLIMNVDTARTG